MWEGQGPECLCDVIETVNYMGRVGAAEAAAEGGEEEACVCAEPIRPMFHCGVEYIGIWACGLGLREEAAAEEEPPGEGNAGTDGG